MTFTMAALLGPISSATPNGAGPFFSVLLLVVGICALMRTIAELRSERLAAVSVVNVIGISAIATLFLAVGIWGLLH